MGHRYEYFVKLEIRVLNDPRFFTMSEFEQLVYLKLLLLAMSFDNKITKKLEVLRQLLRTKRCHSDIQSALNRIKSNFPKFKANKYFYYFDGFAERLPLEVYERAENKNKNKNKNKIEDIKATFKRNLIETPTRTNSNQPAFREGHPEVKKLLKKIGGHK